MPRTKPARVRRSFAPEFKRDAVRRVREGKSLSEVARKLRIAWSPLQNWRKQLEEEDREAFPGKGNASGDATRIRELEYPAHFEIRLVSRNGGIRWSGHWVNVSHVLVEEYVGLEEVGDGIWDFYSGPLRLGRMDERTR